MPGRAGCLRIVVTGATGNVGSQLLPQLLSSPTVTSVIGIALIHPSSVGAYSPGASDRRVSESHPTGGIAASSYSCHKREAERMLDAFEGSAAPVRQYRR